jgi:hypothetical protein
MKHFSFLEKIFEHAFSFLMTLTARSDVGRMEESKSPTSKLHPPKVGVGKCRRHLTKPLEIHAKEQRKFE